MNYFGRLGRIFIFLTCVTMPNSCSIPVQSGTVQIVSETSGIDTQEELPKVDLVLRTEEVTVPVGGSVKLHVFLKNSGAMAVFIYPDLKWGNSASLSLLATDLNDRPIEPDFIDDSIRKPVLDKNFRNVFQLFPNHTLGTLTERKLDDININKPGRYKLRVEYHSPLSDRDVVDRPFWGRENKVIRSNVVVLEVVSNRSV